MTEVSQYPRKGFKAKTIKSILRKKINDWTSSIEDEHVRKLVEKNTIVTGGAIASMLLGEKVNDFDIYFRDYETTLAVARYYVKKFQERKKVDDGQNFKIYVADGNGHEIKDGSSKSFENSETPESRVMVVCKSAGIASDDGVEDKDNSYRYFEAYPDEQGQQYVAEVMKDSGEIEDTYEETQELALENEDLGYRPVFLSTNAITLSGRIQLVIRFWGEPDKIHENYDFVHCTNYWDINTGKLELRPEAMEALLSRELKYVGSRYPICSIIRLRKFIRRGWSINAGQILKILLQISKLDLTDMRTLQEQLTGADASFFAQLISRLKEQDKDRVDSAYLVEIIDRIFN